MYTFSDLNYLTSLTDTVFISANLGVDTEKNVLTIHYAERSG